MNLYPSGDDPGGPLAPADWTMAVSQEGPGEMPTYFADIQRGGDPVCRLTITGAWPEEEAYRLLAVKARLWIDEYLSRPHSGATNFGTLE
ncbi:hypothetical protein [Neorhizobium sp. SHOUNA12B]|uniref:hypothetical protein n=1 Tax=Neorhizobium sp. SHOUNA12B TaxID=2908928 RepID=UPI0025E302D4|nr:hypothetical protein [Neorhizobium sp. SHOUNA12B]MCJ9674760.1 hypothetical protein [Neorhizobium sp. SHOUNA12B]